MTLATDGTHSFTIFNYGQMEWTFGSESYGIDAQVRVTGACDWGGGCAQCVLYVAGTLTLHIA